MEEGLRSCLFFYQRKWSLGTETYMSNQLSPSSTPNKHCKREMGNVIFSMAFSVEREVSSKIFS